MKSSATQLPYEGFVHGSHMALNAATLRGVESAASFSLFWEAMTLPTNPFPLIRSMHACSAGIDVDAQGTGTYFVTTWPLALSTNFHPPWSIYLLGNTMRYGLWPPNFMGHLVLRVRRISHMCRHHCQAGGSTKTARKKPWHQENSGVALNPTVSCSLGINSPP